MTSDAATLLRINKECGAIVAGLFADIIAMLADPLTDIQNLRKFDLVRKTGLLFINNDPFGSTKVTESEKLARMAETHQRICCRSVRSKSWEAISHCSWLGRGWGEDHSVADLGSRLPKAALCWPRFSPFWCATDGRLSVDGSVVGPRISCRQIVHPVLLRISC